MTVFLDGWDATCAQTIAPPIVDPPSGRLRRHSVCEEDIPNA
jgi:hypothetical protein